MIVHNQDLTLENLPHIAGRAYWDRQLAFEDPWRPGHYLYRPLTVMMFAVEKSVFGSKAWAFRLSNLLLHIVSACLVFILVVRILAGSSTGRQSAMASALLFAVHAVHFETVLHIVGRAELGMTAAVLAALVFADKADKDRRWFGATLAAGMLAVLFKEQGLLCPFLVMGYAAFKATPWGRATMVKYACLTFVWSGAYLLARDHAIQGYRPQDTILLPLLDYPFWERAAIMASGLVEYLRLMIWPVDPLLDYHHLVATSPRSFAALWPLLGGPHRLSLSTDADSGSVAETAVGHRWGGPHYHGVGPSLESLFSHRCRDCGALLVLAVGWRLYADCRSAAGAPSSQAHGGPAGTVSSSS